MEDLMNFFQGKTLYQQQNKINYIKIGRAIMLISENDDADYVIGQLQGRRHLIEEYAKTLDELEREFEQEKFMYEISCKFLERISDIIKESPSNEVALKELKERFGWESLMK